MVSGSAPWDSKSSENTDSDPSEDAKRNLLNENELPAEVVFFLPPTFQK